MTRPAAFFDIDRTLVVGTSLEHCFLRLAWQEQALSLVMLGRALLAGLQALGFLPGGKPFPFPSGLPFFTRLRYAFLSGNKSYLRGWPLERCQALAEETLRREVLPRLSPAGMERIRRHQAEGRRIVLFSGTLDFLGEPLRAYLSADRLVAARPEVRAGVLTGRLVGPHPYGETKRTLLLSIAAEEGLDLERSYAYADHHTDIPFLACVGHPVAVNPDRRLAREAGRRNWPVEIWPREE
ncbi:MAG: HAD family hydrolase [Chloroflexia bacterium]